MTNYDFEQLHAIVQKKLNKRSLIPGEHPSFDLLVQVMWALMQDDGCPWDRVQTHESISSNMIEEAYEAVDAIEKHDNDSIKEELGDVLLQVVLQSEIARRDGEFTIDDVALGLANKLVRRHPHVFADERAKNAGDVAAIWQDVKAQEKAARSKDESILDSIPSHLPALMQAQKMAKRVEKLGFKWETADRVWDKLAEEIGEFKAEDPQSPEGLEEFGDICFVVASLAAVYKIDAEKALRMACQKFRDRVSAIEKLAEIEAMQEMSAQELDHLWERAKKQTKQQTKREM